jgi:DNA-binding NarL/FixJ family response regulator
VPNHFSKHSNSCRGDNQDVFQIMPQVSPLPPGIPYPFRFFFQFSYIHISFFGISPLPPLSLLKSKYRSPAAELRGRARVRFNVRQCGRPGSWGLDLIPLLKERYGEKAPPVLVYSVYDDYVHFKAAFRSGAKGYGCKSQDTGKLRAAMDQLAVGGIWFSPGHAFRMAAVSDIGLGLTPRARQIFELVQRRRGNREIAAKLGVSLRTVENNLSVLYGKTAAKNRKELERQFCRALPVFIRRHTVCYPGGIDMLE